MSAVNTGNLFSTLTDALSDLDGAFNNIYQKPGLAKDLRAAAEEIRNNVETALDQVPANIWLDENGAKTIEVAIPGKTKENVKVSAATEKGKRFLVIEANAPEQSEEQKAVEQKRQWLHHKIRGMTSLKFKVPVEESLDIKALKAKVENGLLTIEIPPVPEAQPLEFVID